MELEEYRNIWANKPVLREIYNDFYRAILSYSIPGNTLEVGGGSGILTQFSDEIVSLDVQYAPWLDLVADAQSLPILDESFHNIVLVDVLHHIESPILFLKEACRVLKPHGRLVMLEPAITPLSWFFYKFLHEETVDMSVAPLVRTNRTRDKDPFDANQAIPTLLFTRYKRELCLKLQQFSIVDIKYKSLFAYPLSGGFKSWSLLPVSCVDPLLKIEKMLLPILGRAIAFRMLVILEKS